MPVRSTEECAQAVVNSACRGDKYLAEPSWVRVSFFLKAFWPEIIECFNHMLLVTGPGASQRDAVSKRLLDIVRGIKEFLTPNTVPFHELTARLDHERYRRSPY